ncbi:MAG: biotin/lipoate protein ligase [Clostridiales bacterium]|nr:biotin/lipoate protein ligase [Clostridiales bacterium]
MTLQTWRLLDTGAATAAENMAIDEALLILHAEGKSPPTIRFYRWNPPAISLGYFQQLEKEINIEACRDEGVEVVRRITGGRAIFHDCELTYSLVALEENPKVSGSITESYLKIARGLQAGLQKMGAALEMTERPVKSGNKTAACFDAPSWYELVWQGKKVTGSAQTRKNGAILQHGSIPFSMDSVKFFRLLNFPSDKIREKLTSSFEEKACSLEQVLKREVSFQEVAGAIKEGMEEQLDIKLIPGELTDREKTIAQKLVTEKYATKEWNARR